MIFGQYAFTVRFTESTFLPNYLGSTLRGAFGAALKTSVCGNLTRECASCRIATKCLYVKTFEPHCLISNAASQGLEVPPAYVLEPPNKVFSHMGEGESLSFSLLLFGEVNQYLPFFINAVELMGRRGIGRRASGENGGGIFVLDKVEQEQGENIFVPDTGQLLHPPILRHIEIVPHSSVPPMSLTVELLTPLRLKFNNKFQDELPFHLLVRAALRRISSVFSVYADNTPDFDYKQLIAGASQVQAGASQLRWLDWERYSNRQKRRMLLGGMIGTASYIEVPGVYQPILEVASLLHLGKQSTFGLGKLRLTWTV